MRRRTAGMKSLALKMINQSPSMRMGISPFPLHSEVTMATKLARSWGGRRGNGERTMNRMILVLAGLVLLPSAGWTQPTAPLEKYRKLQFPPRDENFAKGWQDRVVLEYEIINAADLKALRSA